MISSFWPEPRANPTTQVGDTNPKVVPWGRSYCIRFVTKRGETLWTGDGWKHSMDFLHDDSPTLLPSKARATAELKKKVIPYILRWQPGYEPRANPTAAQFWGTCAVCWNVFKVDGKGRTSKHGFQRPGDGQLYGRCFGQGKVAWELSPDTALQYVREMLRPEWVAAEKDVDAFASGRIVRLQKALEQTRQQRLSKEPLQYEEITPGHKDWDKIFQDLQYRAAQKARWLREDIETYEKKLAKWEPKPLQPVDPANPTSRKEKVFKVVEKFKTVVVGQEPDLKSPMMIYPPDAPFRSAGFEDETVWSGAKRLIPSGRYWTKDIKQKIPYYDAVDATSGRKVSTGKTREEAEAGATRKGYRPA